MGRDRAFLDTMLRAADFQTKPAIRAAFRKLVGPKKFNLRGYRWLRERGRLRCQISHRKRLNRVA